MVRLRGSGSDYTRLMTHEFVLDFLGMITVYRKFVHFVINAHFYNDGLQRGWGLEKALNCGPEFYVACVNRFPF